VPSAWGEIGHHQRLYPGKLIIRSDEVITYRGRANNPRQRPVRGLPRGTHIRAREGRFASTPTRRPRPSLPVPRDPSPRRVDADQPSDHRSARQPRRGRLLPRLPLGVLGRGDRTLGARRVRDRHRSVGVRQLAEPVHGHGDCGVRAPARARPPDRGGGIERLAQRRADDSILQAPIGRATTVVRAPELSERGIECGVRARRTYVKVTGNGGPDLRFTARHAAAPGRRWWAT
jgi:hypothetical protein